MTTPQGPYEPQEPRQDDPPPGYAPPPGTGYPPPPAPGGYPPPPAPGGYPPPDSGEGSGYAAPPPPPGYPPTPPAGGGYIAPPPSAPPSAPGAYPPPTPPPDADAGYAAPQPGASSFGAPFAGTPATRDAPSTNDWAVIGAGALVFISMFLAWYGVSGLGSFNVSVSGWNTGFVGWFGGLLCVAAAAFVAARVLANVEIPTGSIGPRVIALGLAGLGTILIVLRFITYPRLGGSVGAKYGIFIAIIAGIAQTVFAWLALRESGEALPGRGAGA